MYSCTKTCSLQGLNGYLVDVEVDLTNGLPKFTLVGLADTAIKESVERVRTAVKNAGYDFPKKRITVNLAPANLKKDGSQMDLAIAIAILCATGVIEEAPDEYVFLGELTLDGKINPIEGALPMIISMREIGFRKFIIPFENRLEASAVEDVELYGVKNLEEVVNYFLQNIKLERIVRDFSPTAVTYDNDFSDIKGQASLKRAMEISAASKSNILIMGTPGSGKTMAAKRYPSILPKLDFEESIEVTKIYSVAGLLKEKDLITIPPFRAPHHTASAVSLIGGGRIPKPGEISLAHKGVLFLDELAEFHKHVLEVLRQPMEAKNINISRANASLSYPADFILIAALNPCPCGYFNSKKRECNCSPIQVKRYLSKISHPLLDRIDLHIEVGEVDYSHLSKDTKEESSEQIRNRVEEVRSIQLDRFKDVPYKFNSEIPDRDIKRYIKLNSQCEKILKTAFEKYNMSARTYNKILKTARTIADLSNSESIREEHLLESIQYRSLDDKYWRM